MKAPLLETRRQVMSAIIATYPGGRECAAARLGMPLKKFDNHVYQNAGSSPLTDEQIQLLEQDAGTHFFADFVCQMYSGYFVPAVLADDLGNLDLYQQSMKASARRGAVDQIIAKALEDGVIEPGEAKAIKAAHTHYVAARHAEIDAVIVLHTRQGV